MFPNIVEASRISVLVPTLKDIPPPVDGHPSGWGSLSTA